MFLSVSFFHKPSLVSVVFNYVCVKKMFMTYMSSLQSSSHEIVIIWACSELSLVCIFDCVLVIQVTLVILDMLLLHVDLVLFA